MKITNGRLRGIRYSNDTKGAGIKTACACGGAQPSDTNLEKLREKLSKISIEKPKERKKYLKFEL